MSTPRGGQWTSLKGTISAYLAGTGNVSPHKIVSDTIAAAGGLSIQSPGASPRGVGGTSVGGGRAVSRAVSGLAGFGTALGRSLANALNSLGVEDLRGKPAGEVISRIADHLTEDLSGMERDVLRGALQQALYNAAELVGDPTYENLEASLQSFLAREGIEGFIELFLTQYVFDRVWLLIEDYVTNRTDNEIEILNMETAIEQACRSNVHEEIEHRRVEGIYENLDWFGPDGHRVAESVVTDLEQRLKEAIHGGVR